MYCECIVNRHIGVLNVLKDLWCRWVYYPETIFTDMSGRLQKVATFGDQIQFTKW